LIVNAGVAGFIGALRALKSSAGNPSLRELAKRSGVPRSTLADALDPDRAGLPRLAVVTAFVQACGVSRQEALAWRQTWRDTHKALDRSRYERAGGMLQATGEALG
jgi:hypothetical protein